MRRVSCQRPRCLVCSGQGLWKGRPSGPGRYRWKTGNEYDGEWRDGRMHGQARCTLWLARESSTGQEDAAL